MGFPIKLIGKFVGKAVAREAGLLPDHSRAELVEIVAEGVREGMKRFAADQGPEASDEG
jgi:hypothetical protein